MILPYSYYFAHIEPPKHTPINLDLNDADLLVYILLILNDQHTQPANLCILSDFTDLWLPKSGCRKAGEIPG